MSIATVVKFTSKSAEAFIESYFAGCFRVLSHLQINQFHFDSKQALKIVGFIKDSPTLKVAILISDNIDSSSG